MKTIILYIFPIFFWFYESFSQEAKKDSATFYTMVSASYAYQIPGGDLSDRFLNNSGVGTSLLFKNRKNWIYGVDFNFIFRDTVKETSILDSISTTDGYIIDGNGVYAEVFLYERGFYISAKLGKIIPVFNSNANSGLTLIGSVGLLQHKIRIENTENTAPQIKGDYKKGYDRLTNGLGISEFIGYTYLGKKKLANFMAGFEFIQSWTQCRRDYNFDQMAKDTSKRFDMLSGIKISWAIPIAKRTNKEFYYY